MRDADAFTVDDPRFTTARVVGPSMLSRDGAEHRRHREPFVAPFRLSPVRERFAARVEAETERLIDGFVADGHAELRTQFAGPLAAAIAAEAIGLGHLPTAQVLAWYRDIVAAVDAATRTGEVPEAGRIAAAALAAASRSALGGGASLLAAAAGDVEDAGEAGEVGRPAPAAGGLSPDEVLSNAAVMLFGGIETTEGMIASALLHLLERPEALERVRSEPELAAAALDESLRLEPAAATVDRFATRDVELAGAQIQQGDLVVISIAAANRDPAVFDDPDRFDLDRPNRGRHLAFAAGPHACIGVHLARLEAHTAINGVLRRLPSLRLAEPGTVRGLVFRKPDAVRVNWAR